VPLVLVLLQRQHVGDVERELVLRIAAGELEQERAGERPVDPVALSGVAP
jgi:hypothetical protein